MTYYWRNHRLTDFLAAMAAAAAFWIFPRFYGIVLFHIDLEMLPDLLSRWLAACLTLIGLIVATTGFLTNMIEKAEFLPLAKSKSSYQLWEILGQNLAALFVAATYCLVGSLKSHWGIIDRLFLYAGTFTAIYGAICMSKLVWLMRSVLRVKALNSMNG